MKQKFFFYVILIVSASSLLSPGFVNAQGQYASGLEFGINGGAIEFKTDNIYTDIGYATEVFLQKPLTNHLHAALGVGYAKQDYDPKGVKFTNDYYTGNLKFNYYLMPFSRISPFATVGIGVLNFPHANDNRYWDADGIFGGGLSAKLAPSIRFSVGGAYHLTSGDDFDHVNDGTKDNYLSAHAGFAFSLSQREIYDNGYEWTSMSGEEASSTEVTAVTATKPQLSVGQMQRLQQLKSAKQLTTLSQRIQAIEQQFQAYDEMKELLQKTIASRDKLIQQLEQDKK